MTSEVNPQHNVSTIVQRMPNGSQVGDKNKADLVKDRLNVVGEHHYESGKRRQQEKEYVTTRIGSSHYWEEFEFRVQPKSIWERFKRSPDTKKRPFADPLTLRFLEWEKSIEINFETINRNIATNFPNGFRIKANFFDIKTVISPLEEQEKSIGQILIILGNLASGKDGGNLKVDERKENLDLTTFVENMPNAISEFKEALQVYQAIPVLEVFKEIKEKIPELIEKNIPQSRKFNIQRVLEFIQDIEPNKLKGLNSEKPLTELNRTYNNYRKSMESLVDAVAQTQLESNQPRELEDIDRERSYAMYNAANKRYKQKGVWKIGNNHLKDIEAKYQNPRKYPEQVDSKELPEIKYNILTREEFNDLFLSRENLGGS